MAAPLDPPLVLLAQAGRVLLPLLAACSLAGYGAAGWLLPETWRRHEVVLIPWLGWAVLTLTLYTVAIAFPARLALWPVLALAAMLAIVRLRDPAQRGLGVRREHAGALAGALLALGLALAPHLRQGSLALLVPNLDEEYYATLSEFLRLRPAWPWFDPGPSTGAAEIVRLPVTRALGWIYPYTIAAADTLSGLDPYRTLMPVNYLLYGLSAAGVWLVARGAFGLGPLAATAAALLYASNGFLLWIVGYGFGPNAAALAALPFAVAALQEALRAPCHRHTVFAGIALSVLALSHAPLVAIPLALGIAGAAVAALLCSRTIGPIGPILKGLLWTGGYMALAGLWGHAAVLEFLLRTRLQGFMTASPPEFADAALAVGLGLRPFGFQRDEMLLARLGLVGAFAGRLESLVPWLGLLIAPALAAGALPALRRAPAVAGFAAGAAAAAAFAHFMQRHPYAYFKALTLAAWVWPLLLAGGISALRHVRARRLAGQVAFGAAAPAAAALALLHGTTLAQSLWYYWHGWGWSLPGRTIEAAQRVAAAIPAGASVQVSGRLADPIPAARVHVLAHAMGFHSARHQQRTWDARLRGMLLALLPDRDAVGLVRAHSISREQPAPSAQAALYVLGNTEDSRLHGLLEEDLIQADGPFRLYDARTVPRWLPDGREPMAGEATPERPLRLYLSAAGIVEALSEQLSGPAGTSPRRLLLGFLASSAVEVEIATAGQTWHTEVPPGLSWYATPVLDLPQTVAVRPREGAVRVVAARLFAPAGEAPTAPAQAGRWLSVSGRVEGNSVVLSVWYAARDAQQLAIGALLDIRSGAFARDAVVLPTPLDLNGPPQRWEVRFPPQEGNPTHMLNGTAVAVPALARPPQYLGRTWAVLRIMRGYEELDELPLAYWDSTPEGPVNLTVITTPYLIDLSNV